MNLYMCFKSWTITKTKQTQKKKNMVHEAVAKDVLLNVNGCSKSCSFAVQVLLMLITANRNLINKKKKIIII